MKTFWLLLLSPLLLEADIAFQMTEFEIVGAGIGIIHGDQIIPTTYGSTGTESITPTTRFQACSISKPVTAMGALILLPQTPRLQHLLEHSSGATPAWYPGYPQEAPLPSVKEALLDVTYKGAPGETLRDSGGGNLVIQDWMTRKAGTPFAPLMDHLVLAPLHMTHSTFVQKTVAGDAKPFLTGKEPLEGGPRRFVAIGCHGLWGTPSDLCRFAQEVQEGWPSQEISNALLTPTITPHRSMGFEVNVNRYGKPIDDWDYFMHGGWNNGYMALLIASRTQPVGAVIMINTSAPMGTEGTPREWEFILAVLRDIADARDWK